MIDVVGASRRFASVDALRDVDLTVASGTVHALLGANGAGKSTLVRILATLLKPDRGEIRVAGFDVVRQRRLVRDHIGVVGQFPTVDEQLTGLENLRMIGRLTDLDRRTSTRRAIELLSRFGLAHAADRRAGTYSGGMRRRLDLAAGLVHEPPLLLLDEPTAGLDPQARRELWSQIDELVAEGTTVLLTTQHLDEAERLADAVTILHDGRVTATGTTADLKSRFGQTVVDFGVIHNGEDQASAICRSLSARGLGGALAITSSTVRVHADDPAAMIPVIVRALDDLDLRATTFDVRTPTLDDVMFELLAIGDPGGAAPIAHRAAPLLSGSAS